MTVIYAYFLYIKDENSKRNVQKSIEYIIPFMKLLSLNAFPLGINKTTLHTKK